MATYVALLRSVTVSGRTLAMADLERVVSSLGFGQVRTYGEGGNILFDAGDGEPLAHAAAIETAVERDLGPRVGALVVTADELARVAAADPFLREPGIGEQALHVAFLFPPDEDFGAVSEIAAAAAYRAAFDKLSLPAAEDERAVFAGPPDLAHAGRVPAPAARPRGHEADEALRRALARHRRCSAGPAHRARSGRARRRRGRSGGVT